MGMPVYLAGGVVRDLLLGRPVQDLDIAVEGDAIKLARSLQRTEGGKALAHPKFGTATWELPAWENTIESQHRTIDLATARTERYAQPGALPVVEFSSIEQDLRRRDFTINAMALPIQDGQAGALLDPFGGRKDLAKGLVCALHAGSFLDDPTRMLRAIRYASRYGFRIAPETRRLINPQSRSVLARLSGERLRHELDLVLDEADAAGMLRQADELELLQTLHSDLGAPGPDFARLHDSVPDPRLGLQSDRLTLGYLLWLMDLSPEQVSSLGDRLSFNASLAHMLAAAAMLRAELPGLRGSPPSKWTTRLDKVPPLSIYALYLRSEEPALASYLVKWRNIKAGIDGEELKRRGLVPGPFFKKALTRLRAAWLDGEVSSAAEENALLERILRE